MGASQEQGRRIGRALASCAVFSLFAGTALAQISAGVPGDEAARAASRSYQLIDPAFGAPRFYQPLGLLRVEAIAALAPRHEMRFSTWAIGRGSLDSLPGVSLGTLATDTSLRLDPARATYRYTFLSRPNWDWKLGVSANMREFGDVLRPGLADRVRFGALPLLHFGAEGRLTPRWRLAVDADGLMTARGRALDLGLRVNYSLTPNFLLFGGYRLTDSAGEAEEFYGNGLSNAANVGLRYRF